MSKYAVLATKLWLTLSLPYSFLFSFPCHYREVVDDDYDDDGDDYDNDDDALDDGGDQGDNDDDDEDADNDDDDMMIMT